MSHAGIIDFVKLTEGAGQLGESAWSPLIVNVDGISVRITATKNDQAAFAYLDNRHAGLGVCGNVAAENVNKNRSGLGTNVCNPGSDDNVTDAEVLYFEFSSAVTIDKIWLNNTHDPDFTIDADDFVDIDGTPTAGPGNGYAPTSDGYNNAGNMASVHNYLGDYSVAANTKFSIAFNDQQFYVSGMEVTAVPEPGSLALLGAGLLGMGVLRRRKNA